MPCSCCGFEATSSSGGHAAAGGGSVRPAAPARCARCGAAPATDATAARYRDKVRLLARFGLASDTRLLREPSPEDA